MSDSNGQAGFDFTNGGSKAADTTMTVVVLVAIGCVITAVLLKVYATCLFKEDEQVVAGNARRRQLLREAAADKGHRGLTISEINALPTGTFLDVKSSADCECVVCLEQFQDESVVRTLPSCGHTFHKDCIDLWLGLKDTCPKCRFPLRENGSSVVVPEASQRSDVEEGRAGENAVGESSDPRSDGSTASALHVQQPALTTQLEVQPKNHTVQVQLPQAPQSQQEPAWTVTNLIRQAFGSSGRAGTGAASSEPQVRPGGGPVISPSDNVDALERHVVLAIPAPTEGGNSGDVTAGEGTLFRTESSLPLLVAAGSGGKGRSLHAYPDSMDGQRDDVCSVVVHHEWHEPSSSTAEDGSWVSIDLKEGRGTIP